MVDERVRAFLLDSPVPPLPEGLADRARDVATRLAGLADKVPDLRPGEGLGDYEIIREIGRGGQGVVYLARHRQAEWLCALKVPRRGIAHRLLREARLAAKLVHPHIVLVRDVQIGAPRPFLVMDHCARGSLAEPLAAEPEGMKSLSAAKEIARSVLEALSYAHAHGIVHRDVKPANILFDGEGRARVCDFGIGTVPIALGEESAPLSSFCDSAGGGGAGLPLAAAAPETFTRLAGTPRYMAPEQEDPRLRVGGRIDGRADIFALGKVIYEMLTGASPQTVRPASRRREWIPEAWDEFIFRCVEERPEARFRDAAHALAALGTLPVAPSRDAARRAREGEARRAALDVEPEVERTRPAFGAAAPGPGGEGLLGRLRRRLGR